MSLTVPVRVSEQRLDAIRKLAKEHERPIRWEIDIALGEYIKRQGEKKRGRRVSTSRR